MKEGRLCDFHAGLLEQGGELATVPIREEAPTSSGGPAVDPAPAPSSPRAEPELQEHGGPAAEEAARPDDALGDELEQLERAAAEILEDVEATAAAGAGAAAQEPQQPPDDVGRLKVGGVLEVQGISREAARRLIESTLGRRLEAHGKPPLTPKELDDGAAYLAACFQQIKIARQLAVRAQNPMAAFTLWVLWILAVRWAPDLLALAFRGGKPPVDVQLKAATNGHAPEAEG